MRRIAVLASMCFFLAGCGAGAPSQSTAEPTLTPTSILPTHAFQQPTEPPAFATASAATRTAEAVADAGAGAASANLDPEAVERGRGRYEALACGDCHGANGEGGDAPALAGTQLSEDEFITFLRTGGTIGNDHLYATNRLSTSGGVNLYLYILSLANAV
jgi:mono/diheme cytochrome c family protein